TDRAAFIEPVSAACEVLSQINLSGTEKIAVLGDGRLGILCAWALATVSDDVTLVGHHPEKLEIARWRNLKTTEVIDAVTGADLVVEATGKPQGFRDAMAACRPRGTLVLKSTLASQGELNLAPLVIDEITVVGSRCGLFKEGIALLQQHGDMPVERLITAKYPLDQALEAFTRAEAPGTLKILLEAR
ncbi:MAG: zinc-binding dehydrogenase, partial [Desulfobacterales bacterium]|nr:zinc-binding dehydrogenase [Desulfobacterales bacterium]